MAQLDANNPYASPQTGSPIATESNRKLSALWRWVVGGVVALVHAAAQVAMFFLALMLAGGPAEPTPVFDAVAAIIYFPLPLLGYLTLERPTPWLMLTLAVTNSLVWGCAGAWVVPGIVAELFRCWRFARLGTTRP
jgi:hypothetical protein